MSSGIINPNLLGATDYTGINVGDLITSSFEKYANIPADRLTGVVVGLAEMPQEYTQIEPITGMKMRGKVMDNYFFDGDMIRIIQIGASLRAKMIVYEENFVAADKIKDNYLKLSAL